MSVRVAYLNSQYPSLSHTFIEREVRAARAAGVEIRTFSVRPAPGGDFGPAYEAALNETTVLLSSWAQVLRDAIAAALKSPVGALRCLARSQRLAPPGMASRLRHLGYVLEAFRLVTEMRRAALTHVHVHMANNGAAIALLACVYDPRLTYSLTIHGSAEFFHVDSWTLAPKAEQALFVRCISSFCRAQVMAWTRPDSWARFRVVRCGIDPAMFSQRPARTQTGPLRLLTVGRMVPIKGYHVLLEACAGLNTRGVDWTLDMVGDGPQRTDLERAAHNLGIAGRITFSGPVPPERILHHFLAADAMVVSSFMEGVPVVLMEAMACGLAIVSTQVGGVPELVEPGLTGELCPPGNPEALTDALVRIAAARPRFGAMGHAARQTVCRLHDIHAVGRDVAALFQEYAGPRRRTHPP